MEIVRRIRSVHPEFSLHHTHRADLDRYRRMLTAEQIVLLDGTLRNFELTQEARTVLAATPLDHHRVGKLLTEHHRVLRDVQRISTPRIDRMLDAALEAGAYGGKINGSGGGGCMFAYAPERTGHVVEAIERAGGTAYVVHVDEGARAEVFKEAS
jgi:galactokinase